MDPAELLQVSMVEEDKPLVLNDDAGDAKESTTDDACTFPIPTLDSLVEAAYPSMIISDEEMHYYTTLFPDIENVKYKKLHCTSCQIHMGTAPIAEHNRFEHPLLKVLVCEQCYNFYSSGDFEKDADGSELYCRWCGQGGQVYCCAKCPFVFCKKCIQKNVGRSMVTHVDSSDDWLCFACNPRDIWLLRGLNWALKQYSRAKNSIRVEDRTPEDNRDIITDYSACCKKSTKKPTTNHTNDQKKIKESDAKSRSANAVLVPIVERLNVESEPIVTKSQRSENAILVPKIEPIKIAKSQKSQNVAYLISKSAENKPTDEVVCTPDIISIDDSPPASPAKKKIETQKFLQVKPASKLIDPAINHVTIKYPSSSHINLTAIQNNPVVSGMIHNIQKNLRVGEPQKIIKIVSPDGRAYILDPTKLTHENVEKMSTTKTHPNRVAQTVTLSQTNNPPPLHIVNKSVAAKPVAQLSQSGSSYRSTSSSGASTNFEWFHKNIVGLQKLAQLVTTITASLVNTKKDSTRPNGQILYNIFQHNLKIIFANLDQLKEQLAADYLQFTNIESQQKRGNAKSVPSNDFGQHFLSFADSFQEFTSKATTTPTIVHPTGQIYPSNISSPPKVILVSSSAPLTDDFLRTNQLQISNVKTDMTNNQSGISDVSTIVENQINQSRILKNILETTTNPLETTETNVDGGQEEQDDSEMIDPNNLLEQSLEVGDEIITNDLSKTNSNIKTDSNKESKKSSKKESDEENQQVKIKQLKKLKKHLSKVQKQIAKRRKLEKTNKTDEIFEMDVTCDSDEDDDISDSGSVDSVYSIKSSDSDSDCVVVNDENNEDSPRKRKVRQKKSSRNQSRADSAMSNHSAASSKKKCQSDNNDSSSDDDLEKDTKKRKRENEDENLPPSKTVKVDTENKSDNEETIENESNKEDKIEDQEANNGDKNEDQESNNGDKNDQQHSIEENSTEKVDDSQDAEIDISNQSEENILSTDEHATSEKNKTSDKNDENTDGKSKTEKNSSSNQSFQFNSYDLVSIAKAIRESIQESHSIKPKRKKRAKSPDLEQLLSSNVVYKKSNESETKKVNGKESSPAGKSSFGDAFSNFVATANNDDEEELSDNSDAEKDEVKSNSKEDSDASSCKNEEGNSENESETNKQKQNDDEKEQMEDEKEQMEDESGEEENDVEKVQTEDKSANEEMTDEKKCNSHSSIKEAILTEDSSANFEDSLTDHNTTNYYLNNSAKESSNSDVDLETEMAVLQKLAENCIAEESASISAEGN